MENEGKNLQKTNINCLSCIYGVNHLNSYRMETFKK